MSDNNITISGNLTRDPELRFTTGGRAATNFSVAVSRRYQVNNEWQEQTSFFNCVAWGPLGENVAATFTKGQRVIVSGRLEQRSYEKDGEKKSLVEVVVDDMGPSLKWARCEIERVVRDGAGQGGGYQSQAPSGSPSPNRAPDPIYGDEEPF